MNSEKVITGLALIGFSLTPTPDDVTVVSPVVQFLAGSLILVFGLFEKDKK